MAVVVVWEGARQQYRLYAVNARYAKLLTCTPRQSHVCFESGWESVKQDVLTCYMLPKTGWSGREIITSDQLDTGYILAEVCLHEPIFLILWEVLYLFMYYIYTCTTRFCQNMELFPDVLVFKTYKNMLFFYFLFYSLHVNKWSMAKSPHYRCTEMLVFIN